MSKISNYDFVIMIPNNFFPLTPAEKPTTAINLGFSVVDKENRKIFQKSRENVCSSWISFGIIDSRTSRCNWDMEVLLKIKN